MLNSLVLQKWVSVAAFAAEDAPGPDAHVYNHPFIKSESGWWLWSGNQGTLVLSGLILIFVGWWVSSKIKTGPESQGTDRYITKSRFAHLVEVICVYLRDEVARPLLHDRADKMMPLLWTIFFFVLVNNLLGLLPILDLVHLLSEWKIFPASWAAEHRTPIGGTATQNIWVTGVLALIAGVFFNLAAVKQLGVGGYVKHLTAGSPWYSWIIIVPIEFLGQVLIKPVALAIRLFANMTAGHILLATLFMFIAQVWAPAVGTAVNKPLAGSVTVISVLGGIAVTFLELFVAFLQAFIFMFLTTVFISLMDHHDEHGHEHEHDHAHGHEPAHAHA